MISRQILCWGNGLVYLLTVHRVPHEKGATKGENIMKILISFLVILTAFLVTSNAIASSNKPPKQACYLMNGDGDLLGRVLALAFKRNGIKFRDVDNKMKFYTVMGGIFVSSNTSGASPITGSAYYDEFSGWYLATITGHEGGDVSCKIWLTDNGEDDAICTVLPGAGIKPVSATYDLMEYDCKLLDFDGSAQ